MDVFRQCIFHVDSDGDDAAKDGDDAAKDGDNTAMTRMKRKYDALVKEYVELRTYSVHLYCETIMLYYLAGKVPAARAVLSERDGSAERPDCIYTQFEMMQDRMSGHAREAEYEALMAALRAANDRERGAAESGT